MGYRMNILGWRKALTWADADAWYRSIVPIRGTEVRPAFERRNKNLLLRKGHNDSIVLRLYNTDVVTWHTDDSITIRVAGWKTATTADAIFRATQLVVQFGPNASFVRTDTGYYAFTDQITLKKDGTPSELTPVYRKVLNRTTAKNARKDMSVYAQWCGVTNRLGVQYQWRNVSLRGRDIVANILDNKPGIEDYFLDMHHLTRGNIHEAYAIAYAIRGAYSYAPVSQPIPRLTETLRYKLTMKGE